MKKETIQIIPHPDKVLIKVSKREWDTRFSKYITTSTGDKVELFTDIEEEPGYEKRFQQNVSVGTVLAVGENVEGVLKGDIAIIDYSVTGNDDALIGFFNGDRLVCIDAMTTYHKDDSPPQMNGRHAYVVGDFDNLSKLMGVVRSGKLISFSPYVFLQHEDAKKLKVSKSGVMYEENDTVCNRNVLAADTGFIAGEGDAVLINESDLFSRVVSNKEISVVFERDVIGVL